jgi:hypothetical protein
VDGEARLTSSDYITRSVEHLNAKQRYLYAALSLMGYRFPVVGVYFQCKTPAGSTLIGTDTLPEMIRRACRHWSGFNGAEVETP